MSSELATILNEIRPAMVSIALGAGLVLQQKLANAQEAIRRHGSQKAVAIDAHIPETRLAAKLRARGADVLNLRDLDKMPVPVQQTFHWLELIRLGLPEEVTKTEAAMRVVRRVLHKRSA